MEDVVEFCAKVLHLLSFPDGVHKPPRLLSSIFYLDNRHIIHKPGEPGFPV